MKYAVINFTDELMCDGRRPVAVGNLGNLHNVLGMDFGYDNKNILACDITNKTYSYYNFIESDKTEIERIGKNCYNIKVSNCEIFEASDKLAAEIILNYNSM